MYHRLSPLSLSGLNVEQQKTEMVLQKTFIKIFSKTNIYISCFSQHVGLSLRGTAPTSVFNLLVLVGLH